MKDSGYKHPGKPDALRFIPIGAIAALFLASCAAGGWFGLIGEFPLHLPWLVSGEGQVLPAGFFIGLFAIQWFLCILMLLLLPKDLSLKQKALFLLMLALACRILLMAHEPSDDMNRYLWEGKVLINGISPYHHAPHDAAFRYLAENDPFHSAINHPDMPAAYPPLMLTLFSVAGIVFYHPLTIKIILLLFDMGTMGFLCLLLKHRSLDLRWLILYAFNPVVLYAFVGQGHFDVIQ